MQITRRSLVSTGAAALAATALPRAGWTGTTLDLGGGKRIDTLSDGHLVLPAEFLLGTIPPEDAAPILDQFGQTGDRYEPPCNLTLYRDGINTVLFDAGSGPNLMPSAGKLLDAFDALGLSPEEVTHVVFTHAHPDHIWGVLDDFDDPLFYEAQHLIGKDEFDYWMDPATVDTIRADRQSFAVGAISRLEAIEDTISTFADGEEILPGIATVATYGHTPGHMAFEIRPGGESVMVVGDAIANPHLAFIRPDWPTGSDQDPETGMETRARLLDRLATEQTTFVGFHLPEGGIGRAEKTAEGYRFVSEGM